VDPEAWNHNTPPAFDGMKVWAANPVIIAMLEESGALLAGHDLEHSYPHCWRCHIRSSSAPLSNGSLALKHRSSVPTAPRRPSASKAIEEIDKVVWDPAWGKERITNMIATRPDWCISRQRIWGVPIAVFLCESCQQPILDPALNSRIVKLFEEHGAEAWHTTEISALLPANNACAHCGGTHPQGNDILDVVVLTPAQAGLPYARATPS